MDTLTACTLWGLHSYSAVAAACVLQGGELYSSLASLDRMGYSPTLQRRPSTLRLHPPPADSQGDAHPLVDSRQVMVQSTAGGALCDGDGQTTL